MIVESKILIVEDERPLLTGLSILLRRKGYDVISADNGQKGLELAKNESPDLIISDVMMPQLDGFQFREILKDDPGTRNIPFIFLTARIEMEDKLVGLRAGADDYITKPFDHNELIARVESVLRRKIIERNNGREDAERQAKLQMEEFKREILQNYHHEMRTPMLKILLPLEIAVAKKYSDPEELIHFTKMALSNANHLQYLVEDFIILTNLDNGNLNTLRQAIQLDYDFHKPIAQCQDRYKDKNLDVTVHLDGTGQIYAPRNEFKRVIFHLVDNALKFSDDGGVVKINLKTNDDGGCSIIVSDEGPGIPEEIGEKVFERYYQASQGDTRTHEGLGIGLTISRAIAQTLHGNVQILNSDGGCVVEFTLPSGHNDFER